MPIVDYLINRSKRTPYFHLGKAGSYMERFWLRAHNQAKSNWAARIHHVRRSDHDRALHDHPWLNISVLLRHGYWEVLAGAYQRAVEASFLGHDPTLREMHSLIHRQGGKGLSRSKLRELKAVGIHWRGPLAIVIRKASLAHRLVLPAGTDAWSLFIMGPKTQDWGFHTPDGWVHNEQYDREPGADSTMAV